MNNDFALLLGFEKLKNNTAIFNGETIDCVFDASAIYSKKNFGMEAYDNCNLTVKTADVPNIKQNDSVTTDGKRWEVFSIRRGTATTFLTLYNPNKL